MPYALRTGVTFCVIGRRVVFLDVLADRYFALSAESERSFLALVDGSSSEAETGQALAPMVSDGLLISVAHATPPRPCPALDIDFLSVLDQPLPSSSAWGAIQSLRAIFQTRIALAFGGLARVVNEIETRKANLSEDKRPPTETPRGITAQFLWAERYTGRLDGCLWHSLALAHRLLDVGVAPTVVFGVQLGPFAAHCWVQAGSLLLNDRHGFVRNFTPILSI